MVWAKAQLEHFQRGQRRGIYFLYDFYFKGELDDVSGPEKGSFNIGKV